jgi:hypothetical protein
MSIDIARHSSIAVRISSIGFALLACAGAPSAIAEDAVCTRVFDSMIRVIKTPNHTYMSQSTAANGGKVTKSEAINTGKARYLLIDGKWMASKITPEDELQQSDENRKNMKSTCRLIRDESVDGVSATLYSTHSETEYGVNDSQVWISKASSLPLRQQIDIDVGGSMGKSHTDVRFDYSNVAAPPGVK